MFLNLYLPCLTQAGILYLSFFILGLGILDISRKEILLFRAILTPDFQLLILG
jgi:hypothetical protein